MKKYRVYYHYRKYDRKMSVHFRNKCYPVDDVVCLIPCESKRNKIQPRLVMRGFATEVNVELKDGKLYAIIK